MNSTTVITLYAPQVTSTNALGKLSCVNDINKHQKYVLPFIWKKNKEIEPQNLKNRYWINYDWMRGHANSKRHNSLKILFPKLIKFFNLLKKNVEISGVFHFWNWSSQREKSCLPRIFKKVPIQLQALRF